jgi:hypothetical protein
MALQHHSCFAHIDWNIFNNINEYSTNMDVPWKPDITSKLDTRYIVNSSDIVYSENISTAFKDSLATMSSYHGYDCIEWNEAFR